MLLCRRVVPVRCSLVDVSVDVLLSCHVISTAVSHRERIATIVGLT